MRMVIQIKRISANLFTCAQLCYASLLKSENCTLTLRQLASSDKKYMKLLVGDLNCCKMLLIVNFLV